jgi:hypothetical protein
MDSKVFEKRLKRCAGEGLRHEKGHFRKCPDLDVCDPVRIRVIFAKHLKVNIPHSPSLGAVTNGSLIGIDAVESFWTTTWRVKIVTLSHSSMKDSEKLAYFYGSERTTINIQNRIHSSDNSWRKNSQHSTLSLGNVQEHLDLHLCNNCLSVASKNSVCNANKISKLSIFSF